MSMDVSKGRGIGSLWISEIDGVKDLYFLRAMGRAGSGLFAAGYSVIPDSFFSYYPVLFSFFEG